MFRSTSGGKTCSPKAKSQRMSGEQVHLDFANTMFACFTAPVQAIASYFHTDPVDLDTDAVDLGTDAVVEGADPVDLGVVGTDTTSTSLDTQVASTTSGPPIFDTAVLAIVHACSHVNPVPTTDEEGFFSCPRQHSGLIQARMNLKQQWFLAQHNPDVLYRISADAPFYLTFKDGTTACTTPTVVLRPKKVENSKGKVEWVLDVQGGIPCVHNPAYNWLQMHGNGDLTRYTILAGYLNAPGRRKAYNMTSLGQVRLRDAEPVVSDTAGHKRIYPPSTIS